MDKLHHFKGDIYKNKKKKKKKKNFHERENGNSCSNLGEYSSQNNLYIRFFSSEL